MAERQRIEFEGDVVSATSFIYGHSAAERHLSVEHSSSNVVAYAMHVHLGEECCLEMLAAREPTGGWRGCPA